MLAVGPHSRQGRAETMSLRRNGCPGLVHIPQCPFPSKILNGPCQVFKSPSSHLLLQLIQPTLTGLRSTK